MVDRIEIVSICKIVNNSFSFCVIRCCIPLLDFILEHEICAVQSSKGLSLFIIRVDLLVFFKCLIYQ